MSGIGQQIKEARTAARLSQAELARRAGTSQPAVNRYERGQKVPSETTTRRLLQACATRPRPSEVLAGRRDRVLNLAARHGATAILVFGSVARGEDDPDSDLDLLVDIAPEKLRLFDLQDLEDELSELLGFKVDVGTPEMLKPRIRERVLAEARPL